MATPRPQRRRASFARAAALLGLPAIGCSLIIPLDYTGGTPSAGASNAGVAGSLPPVTGGMAGHSDVGGSGGSAGRGGSSAHGGTSGRGGSGGSAGNPEGPGGEAGTGARGGSQGTGGAGMAGEAGEAGAAGDGMGGMTGGEAGMGGSGGCPGVDLETDPLHCGSCTNACATGADCIGAVCIESPCAELCEPAVEVPLTVGDGYRVDNIGTAATCHEIASYEPAPKLPAIIAWEFESTRTLKVNGVTVTAESEPGAPLAMPRRAGGYCVQASAGMRSFAGYKLPLPSTLGP